ncbi:uncharacterized protein IWZ02DRAFT_179130 [Phyllosticta citriasiana]|uniref:uncharacterized protein n=1 Tax=Phyllosticta citriasiana TaxID=595635 RepID=UPI0030FDD011
MDGWVYGYGVGKPPPRRSVHHALSQARPPFPYSLPSSFPLHHQHNNTNNNLSPNSPCTTPSLTPPSHKHTKPLSPTNPLHTPPPLTFPSRLYSSVVERDTSTQQTPPSPSPPDERKPKSVHRTPDPYRGRRFDSDWEALMDVHDTWVCCLRRLGWVREAFFFFLGGWMDGWCVRQRKRGHVRLAPLIWPRRSACLVAPGTAQGFVG